MKKYILAALSITLLASCKGEALDTIQTTNQDFKVEFLFDVDGCKVYRFRDGGYYRYLTTCSGGIQWDEKAGKTTRIMNISTAYLQSK